MSKKLPYELRKTLVGIIRDYRRINLPRKDGYKQNIHKFIDVLKAHGYDVVRYYKYLR